MKARNEREKGSHSLRPSSFWLPAMDFERGYVFSLQCILSQIQMSSNIGRIGLLLKPTLTQPDFSGFNSIGLCGLINPAGFLHRRPWGLREWSATGWATNSAPMQFIHYSQLKNSHHATFVLASKFKLEGQAIPFHFCFTSKRSHSCSRAYLYLKY